MPKTLLVQDSSKLAMIASPNTLHLVQPTTLLTTLLDTTVNNVLESVTVLHM